ncbi:heme oxygenase-like protein [Aulographum hederae CBS 113979]|uniref:Heme oxygenase-like protein n=1 Tax=Aulographum hederae CBS 113979 TaxID=1176131 RepID=A0A6G1GP99_9PEZI|nr:heme oxygenase-like protein [Aulographum hederae CBS 113979]
MGRHANPDIRRAFVEFADDSTPSKCTKVRCLHCGFVRAKNTTRQIEHLQQCQIYLASPEAAQHAAQNPDSTQSTPSSHIDPAMNPNTTRGMLNGTHPNPNLQVSRRGPNANKRGRDGQPMAPPPLAQQAYVPSLTAHLLNREASAFQAATQQPFLSHAGCGTLAAAPLGQWMVQDGHYTRGYIQFIGQLIGKIRLPATGSQFHPLYRTMDLLISALNNIRREMSFFEITATKYGIQLTEDPPSHITRGYMDLFVSVSSPSASLLEGLVVLWATEHCYRTAWLYASSFSTSLSAPPTSPHIAALHQSLIPNWTSPAFSKFVDACRALVDELANSTTSPNGKEEMLRCEQVFSQICWLEERFWPDVDGMGEGDETGVNRATSERSHSDRRSTRRKDTSKLSSY